MPFLGGLIDVEKLGAVRTISTWRPPETTWRPSDPELAPIVRPQSAPMAPSWRPPSASVSPHVDAPELPLPRVFTENALKGSHLNGSSYVHACLADDVTAAEPL
jgi:hypothetical protein